MIRAKNYEPGDIIPPQEKLSKKAKDAARHEESRASEYFFKKDKQRKRQKELAIAKERKEIYNMSMYEEWVSLKKALLISFF